MISNTRAQAAEITGLRPRYPTGQNNLSIIAPTRPYPFPRPAARGGSLGQAIRCGGGMEFERVARPAPVWKVPVVASGIAAGKDRNDPWLDERQACGGYACGPGTVSRRPPAEGRCG